MSEITEELVVRGTKALVAFDFEADSGLGNEQVSAGDKATAFFTILQALSPEVKEEDPKYIEGAKPGMVYNTATKELIEARVTIKGVKSELGLEVVNCSFVPKVVKWGANRSGWKASYDLNDPIVRAVEKANLRGGEKMTKLIDADGDVYTETAYHVVFAPKFGPGLIGMSGHNGKPSRLWNTAITGLRLPRKQGGEYCPPRFASKWLLQTVTEPKYGNFIWQHKFVDMLDPKTEADCYVACKNFSQAVANGELKMVRPPEDVAAGGSDGGKEDVPF